MSVKPKNIVGERYGFLTVLSQGPNRLSPKREETSWNVICDCGNTRNITSKQLKKPDPNNPKRCGKSCPLPTIAKMIGRKFGRWTVVSFYGRDNKREYLWNVICSCGTAGITKTYCLNKGDSKSCGCLQKEKARETGRRNMKKRHELPDGDDGTVRPIAIKIRKMPEYALWRDTVIARDFSVCVICHEHLDSTEVVAHHIRFLSRIIRENSIISQQHARACSILWDVSNGITLCSDCHKAAHRPDIASIC